MHKKIIIGRKLSREEHLHVLNLHQQGIPVFSFSEAEAPDFAKKISLNAEEKRTINYQIKDEILAFGDLQVDSQSIADLLCIEHASTWHYHKFRIYFAVRNLAYQLQLINKHFPKDEALIWYATTDLKHAINLYPSIRFIFQKKKKTPFNIRQLLTYFTIILFRLIIVILSKKRKPDYLLYFAERYSSILDKETLQPKGGHHILEYLIDNLDQRFLLMTEILMPKPRGDSDYLFSMDYFHTTWNGKPKVPFESSLMLGFLNRKVRKAVKESLRKLIQNYSVIEEATLSDPQKIAFKIFQSLHKSSGFFLFRYFAAKRYFKKSSLKAIIASDENSPLSKSIMDAAKHCGIKTIGVQHGAIHDFNMAYHYTQADRQKKIMPDVTLVWGRYWKDFLSKNGNYNPDSVIPVGQLRADIVPVLLKETSKNKTGKTIVFASQPQRDPQIRFQAAYDVFAAVKDLPDTKLQVKLHPRELNDVEYYKSIAVKAGCSNYSIETTSELYHLIASCDVLVTCFSTVGTETVYFYKPLIILDHLKQDMMGYVRDGVAFQAIDAISLEKLLSELLQGDLKVNNKKYDQFIENYAYRIDGKVANRCIQAVLAG